MYWVDWKSSHFNGWIHVYFEGSQSDLYGLILSYHCLTVGIVKQGAIDKTSDYPIPTRCDPLDLLSSGFEWTDGAMLIKLSQTMAVWLFRF